MPWYFFGFAALSALFTLNVYRPVRRIGPLSPLSFMFGWLVGDLAYFHVAWQVIAAVAFIAGGALEAWPGWLGLGLCFASWAGLVSLGPISRRAGPALEEALIEGIGRIDLADLTPDRARGLTRAPNARNVLLPFRFREPGVQVIRDLQYIDDGHPRHRLDVYLPEVKPERAPVLFQVHGGGWVIGNKKEQALPLMNHLAARGWICVTANYRLSPKATFPDHLIDLKHAMAWIRSEIDGFGGDPDFICVTGGSAGGHLSSLLALTANDPAYQPGFESVDTSFRACVPFYGVYDWTNEQGLQAMDMGPFVAKTVMKKDPVADVEDFRRASPMHRIHADAPPFFVIHGDHDSLTAFEEARAFVRLLRERSKAPVAYAEIPGAQHAFDIFHTPRTQHVLPAVERFLAWAHTGYLSNAETPSSSNDEQRAEYAS